MGDIKEETVSSLKQELSVTKGLLQSLKNTNFELESRVKSLDIQILVLKEENANVNNLQDTRISKLAQKDGLLQRQVEMIDQLSNELQTERSENEYNKNKLAVCLVQVKDLDSVNKQLLADKNFFMEKFNSVENLYLKLKLEYETLVFKHENICKDLTNCIIKMNMAIKSRQNTEYLNTKLADRIAELEAEVKEERALRERDAKEITRCRASNLEFQIDLDNQITEAKNTEVMFKQLLRDNEKR